MKHEVIDAGDKSVKLEWLQARNDILDAFADLEARVAFILKRAGKLPPKGQCLGQRIEIFRTVKANSEIATANLVKRDTLANSISELLPVRADIVHSKMEDSPDRWVTGWYFRQFARRERDISAKSTADVSRNALPC